MLNVVFVHIQFEDRKNRKLLKVNTKNNLSRALTSAQEAQLFEWFKQERSKKCRVSDSRFLTYVFNSFNKVCIVGILTSILSVLLRGGCEVSKDGQE